MISDAGHPPRHVEEFDESFDIVVVGYGFAGAVAALTASDHGARVLLIEKMPDPGGISICSGGGLRLAYDRNAALSYLRATNDGTTPDDLLSIFADEMMQLDEYVATLSALNGGTLVRNERPGNYPFPGSEGLYFLQVEDIPGFEPEEEYPYARALSKGTHMFKVLQDNLRARSNIEVRLSSPAARLISSSGGTVEGLWVRADDRLHAIAAKKGVILACGGFESAPDMQRQFWELNPVHSAAFLGNTGDGIRMAQDLGADLWHMWHFHGTYGFRHPKLPFAIRTKRLPDWIPQLRPASAVMSWILVDQKGHRFMNECEPYLQDTGHRQLNRMDMSVMRNQSVPCYMIFDEVGRQLYPVGQVVFNDRAFAHFDWSRDNLDEVDSGLLKRVDTLAAAAEIIGCDVATLEQTLSQWNTDCSDGKDRYGRPAETMTRLQEPPFYIGEIWPVVSNTQGGPRHDAKQRIVNSYGEPIPRLYAAGELGSIWGHIYVAGGNLTECFVGGRVAGREAAALPDEN